MHVSLEIWYWLPALQDSNDYLSYFNTCLWTVTFDNVGCRHITGTVPYRRSPRKLCSCKYCKTIRGFCTMCKWMQNCTVCGNMLCEDNFVNRSEHEPLPRRRILVAVQPSAQEMQHILDAPSSQSADRRQNKTGSVNST